MYNYRMANDIIVKDNRLINAKYNLTRTQSKFIAFMASRIDKDDIDFFTYSMRLNEMLNMLNIKRSNWKQLGRTLKELQTKLIVIQDNDEVIEATALLSYFKISIKDEMVEYRFDKAMKPFLVQLKSNFTKLSLEKIFNFDSQYTIRMYEILEQRVNLLNKYNNKHLLTFTINVEELKEILVGEYNIKTDSIEIKKSYNRYSQFKQKVLDIAYQELKEKGDYYFEYKEIKYSRKIEEIEFKIVTNKELVIETFKEKKKTHLMNGKEKRIAEEQIRRTIERKEKKGAIADKLKYEQKLFQLYLKGELKYDKDLQAIKDELDRKELENMFKELRKDEKEKEKLERIEKFKKNGIYEPSTAKEENE